MLNEKLKILITFASMGKIYFTIEQKTRGIEIAPTAKSSPSLSFEGSP
jgi:hypothetical protein